MGPCTLACKIAVCGDGLLWAGAEQCDNGEANSFDYGGCRPDDCTWGPRCGDGKVDVGIDKWRSERLWTSFVGHPCHKDAHLYCFEDAEPELP